MITDVSNKTFCSTSSKNLFFLKSGILDRSYGSLKQNLHSVVHQHPVVPLPVDWCSTLETSGTGENEK